MNGLENGRAMASPVYASMLKKRHQFGIDGRLLLFPILFPLGIAIPFSHDFGHQLTFAVLTTVGWGIAKVLWSVNPYMIDDFMAEIKYPAFLSGEK